MSTKKTTTAQGKISQNYDSRTGELYPAKNFPSSDVIINKKYDSEGNWAFCRFDDNELYALRVGFQGGQFDLSDYGVTGEKTHLQFHFELMTDHGAYLWLPVDNYLNQKLSVQEDKLHVKLMDNAKTVLEIKGWPDMSWYCCTNDDYMQCDLRVSVENVFSLPDLLLVNNIFSMWIAVGNIKGQVRLGEKNFNVTGSIFYDHPRISKNNNKITPRKWYLYIPLKLDEKRYLIYFYTVNNRDEKQKGQCVGIYIDHGKSVWFDTIELSDILYDKDNIPCAWTVVSISGIMSITTHVHVSPTKIVSSWGSVMSPKTRSEYYIIPLVIDAEVSIQIGHSNNVFKGAGLAEYWRYPN